MYPCPSANRGAIHNTVQIIPVARCDRWHIYHRLQQLTIPCWYLPNGALQVEIQGGLHAWLVWSVVRQFSATRKDLVDWLDQCWDVPP